MNAETEPGGADLKQTGTVIYILYLIGIVIGIVTIAGVIMAYLKRDDAAGTYLESHMTYLIRTFWIALIVGIVGTILSAVGVGVIILIVLLVWYIYRVVKGFVAFNDGRPVADPTGWL